MTITLPETTLLEQLLKSPRLPVASPDELPDTVRILPLSAQILGRRDGKMASLGLALHMRHVLRAAKRGLRGS